MNLTKEQAIQEHRKMWNWIEEQYENGIQERISMLKSEYLGKNFPDENIIGMCFCCEYCCQKCDNCPLQWVDIYGDKTDKCYSEGALYHAIIKFSDKKVNEKECAFLARKIANLEEK